jgi:hypothetical protein
MIKNYIQIWGAEQNFMVVLYCEGMSAARLNSMLEIAPCRLSATASFHPQTEDRTCRIEQVTQLT